MDLLNFRESIRKSISLHNSSVDVRTIMNITSECFKLCVAEHTEEVIVIICEEFIDMWENTCKKINNEHQMLLDNPIIDNRDVNNKIAEILFNEEKTNQINNFEKKVGLISRCSRYINQIYMPIAQSENRIIKVRNNNYQCYKLEELLRKLIN